MPPIAFSSWVYFVVSVLAVANAFFGLPQLHYVIPALIVLFLALEFRLMPGLLRALSLFLIAVGIALALMTDDPLAVLVDGLWKSQFFLLIFFSISWLQVPTEHSPALIAVRRTVVTQPAGRRFAVLSLTLHIIGGFLNLAGLSLLSPMADKDAPLALRRRLTPAIMQGFTSVSCWSPLYIGMAVVVLILPGISWIEMLKGGLFLSPLILLSGWAYDRIALRRAGPGDTPADPPAPLSGLNLFRLTGIVVTLAIPILYLVLATDFPIPITLGLVAPPFTLLWMRIIAGGAKPVAAVEGRMTRQVITALSSFRGEVMIFVAANVFGVGIASQLTPEAVGSFLDALNLAPDLMIIGLVVCFLLVGAAGLHPVVLVIPIAAVLPAAALGLTPVLFGLLLVGIWGITVLISPFSGLTLYMSRVTGVSIFTIAWRWNLPFVLAAASTLTAAVIAIRHLGLI